MTLGYFDTSALMRWVESEVPIPRARDAHVTLAIDALVADGNRHLAVSWLTLLELRAAISWDWRHPDAENSQFDGHWANKAIMKVMEQVAKTRFELTSVPPRAFEHAITLFDLATEEHGIALGTWDAIHLITASSWSHTSQEVVDLYTCDDGFKRFVDYYPEFNRFVRVVDMNP